MTMMDLRKTICILASAWTFSLATVSLALAGDIDDAKELLFMWQPEALSLKGSALTVVLPQRQITQEIYLAVIQTGICLGPLTGKPLPEVSSVEVLNQFSQQGYVYEAGTGDCDKINELPASDEIRDVLVLGKTHSFSTY